MSERIQIAGIRELNKALRAAEDASPKMTRLALNQASDLLISRIRPKIPTKSGRAAGSLKARSSQSSARIAVGGKKAPYYPWLDFGGVTGKSGAKRRFIREGRYVYPTLRQNRDEILAIMEKALADLVREAGLELT